MKERKRTTLVCSQKKNQLRRECARLIFSNDLSNLCHVKLKYKTSGNLKIKPTFQQIVSKAFR